MFNVGIGTNRFVGQAKSRYLNGLFASAEMSPIKDLALQGEFDGEDLNIGAKYSYKNFGFKVGVNALEDWFKDTITRILSNAFEFYICSISMQEANASRPWSYAGYGNTPSMGRVV
jgi:hypothetical protein